MIVEALVDLAFGVLVAFTGFLPDVPLDLSGLGPVFGVMMGLNEFVPVAESLAVAGTLLGVWGLMFAWRVLRTLLSHVPLFGGNG